MRVFLTLPFIRKYIFLFVFSIGINTLAAQEAVDTIVEEVYVETADYYDEPPFLFDTIFTAASELSPPGQQYKVRAISPKAIDSLKKDASFWYADIAPEQEVKEQKNESSRSEPITTQPWFRNVIWFIIVLAFVLVLIWYLADSNISIFRKAPKPIVNDGELPENIYEIQYKPAIDKAVSENDFRLAIRLLFLQLLKQMDENGIIQYEQARTNLDYRMHLYGSSYAKGFDLLARHYEYAWYGKWEIPGHIFDRIRNEFEVYHQQMGRA